jgi:hypothetical protein
MNQRGVTLIATYLAKRPLGRIVQVRNVGDDDYLVAVEDRRDGRTQLIHSSGDLRLWFESFRHGECLIPAAGICARCGKLYVDRDIDGELLAHCLPCCGVLIEAGAHLMLIEEV